MTPADYATEQPEAPFSVRRRQRGGRRIVQVSSSLSAMDALRARIRSQSKAVAERIAWYRRCLRMSKGVFRLPPGAIFSRGFIFRGGLVFFGLYLSTLPALADGFCPSGYPNELPSPYITYAISGKVLSRALILDDGTEYPCGSRLAKRLAKHETITSAVCGPLTLSWGEPFKVACTLHCILSYHYATAYILTDKNKTVFTLGLDNKDNNYSYSSDYSRVYRSDAVVSTNEQKWGIKDTDRTIRLRTVSECPVQHLPRPAL
jgi:hypothetical protein